MSEKKIKKLTKTDIGHWLSIEKNRTGYHRFSYDFDKYEMHLVACLLDGRIQMFKPDNKFQREADKYKYIDVTPMVVKWIKQECTKQACVDEIYKCVNEYFGLQ